MLAEKRLAYIPKIPPALQRLLEKRSEPSSKPGLLPEIAALFPHLAHVPAYRVVSGEGEKTRPLKVAALFSGGPAAGGHNVLTGLFDALQEMNPKSQLFGFLGGFSGILENKIKELDRKSIDAVRNQGGFDLIGTGRVKLETKEDLALAKKGAQPFDAVVVIGGDDSNTNAAVLAEYLLAEGCKTSVIGIPKTIDGDLRSPDIEMSFGFDSACKTYSELIGNLCRDVLATRKYYHFVKLMGRSASHIALECALQVQPNLTLIGEEGKSLEQIVQEIADLIVRRERAGKEFGVVLVPEGLIEFVPEIKELIRALSGKDPSSLSGAVRETYEHLPEKIQKQLTRERDAHGNVTVSQIDTQQLLIELVQARLATQNFQGKCHFQDHFFGYEGRSCLPTNFDADYGYSLGRMGALAARDGLTGVICGIRSLNKGVGHWEPRFAPIAPLLRLEERKGKKKPVIDKTLVDVKSKPYLYFSLHGKEWEVEDKYRFPGPIQFFGETDVTDSFPLTMR